MLSSRLLSSSASAPIKMLGKILLALTSNWKAAGNPIYSKVTKMNSHFLSNSAEYKIINYIINKTF